ncbi:3'-5' exonuclease [Cellulomonas sp. ICMP 17802]|uniref:3'-5' exonuclease n=1 Tax=Cellulomonas sp. ICMP 17802 TaxID=3239199 RepID=UPI00351B3BC4
MAKATLEACGFIVHTDPAGWRPPILAHHASRGLLALGLSDGSNGAMVALNRQIAILRDEIPAVRRERFSRFLVSDGDGPEHTSSVLSPVDVAGTNWIEEIPVRLLDEQVRADVVAAYRPAAVIDVPIRLPLDDDLAGERAALRIALDRQQADVVADDASEVVVVTGPPGSGKTLVLVARARRVALAHPKWTIQVLCFNNMLVSYLESLVADVPNIQVNTFGKFAHRYGFRVHLSDEGLAGRDVARHLPVLRANPPLDALVIDEAQDFFPSWIDFAVASVRPGHGGIAVAGDPKQALYREGLDDGIAVEGRLEVRQVVLQRPYRSTRQILDVTSALGPSSVVSGRAHAFEGEPVDLVWSEKIDGQAASVARDAKRLIESGQRNPQDIGVLVTRKFHIGRLRAALEGAGVPVRAVYANQAGSFSLGEPTVTVMTVHSAKGLEFDVVFLVGLENLPEGEQSEEAERQGRAGYVGMTRARDQLIVTYSKDNAYLERIRGLPVETLRRWVWPDDFPEE